MVKSRIKPNIAIEKNKDIKEKQFTDWLNALESISVFGFLENKELEEKVADLLKNYYDNKSAGARILAPALFHD